MTSVNITELRQNLAAYLEQVRKGRTLRITSRGKVIAELSPPAATADEVQAARALLRGSVRRYDRPLEPAAGPEEWDVNR